MITNAQAARLEEIARTNARACPPHKRAPLVEELPEIALALIAALLLSLFCC